MDPTLYYRRALIAPFVILPALAFIPIGDLSTIALWAMIIGGVPYLVLALFLMRRGRVVAFKVFWRMLLLSPFMMVPLIFVWCSTWGLIMGDLEASLLFSMLGSVYAIVLGYLFIGVAAIIRMLMERVN